ncbi:helix-turn-helix domain-containing protein [Terrabacter sp. NPDC000476]|uniref:helix-turn-helix domain-containing protein n=1 Tax=Terrabacter sp. NPDC000476 TaxID=3154258 RepID=UPI00331E7EC4
MLTGDDIKRARQMAGLSQGELANLVGVSMRSIGNYERGETVPRAALPKLQEVLGPYLGGHGPSLATATDAELLGEIAKRFARVKEDGRGDTAPTKEAGQAGASVTELKAPTREELEDGRAAAHKSRRVDRPERQS